MGPRAQPGHSRRLSLVASGETLSQPRWGHLARRFAGSLWPAGPGPATEAWAHGLLSPGEAVLWRRMSGPDRRHGAAVARRVADGLGGNAGGGDGAEVAGGDVLLVAALLHDVGKVEAGLGTMARVAVTLLVQLGGRHRGQSWSESPGWRGPVGRYLVHDRLGAELLTRAGSHPLVVAWAGQHHRPAQAWSVPAALGRRLKAADDD